MADEFRLGDRRPGRREHDHQRCYARDAVVGGAQGDDRGGIVAIVRPLVIRHAAGDCDVAAAHMPESFRAASLYLPFDFCGPNSRTRPAWRRTELKLLSARCGGAASSHKLLRLPTGWRRHPRVEGGRCEGREWI